MTETRDTSPMMVIGCERSAGAALARLADEGRELPPHVQWQSVPCGGSIDELMILEAFENGAERVMVVSCAAGACNSLVGDERARRRTAAARELLESVGVSSWRLRYETMAPNMGSDLLRWVDEFVAPEESIEQS
ncbi:MAG: hydrogenase iron-sulfur subunit [Anaerolineae bacterium]